MQQEKMHLVVFDIDGTLTATNKVDNECFVLAMQEGLQITDIDTDWTKYRNVTDQGCLEEIVYRHKRRYGTQTELNRVKQRHLVLLQGRADSDAKLFRSIAGAHETIERLKMLPNVRIALATGAWLESAQIKLRTARFTMEGIPMATCNDSISREEIIRIAESRAIQTAGARFETKTYVGDAVWDLQAASRLSYQFIGVYADSKAERLRAEGARQLISDYGNGEIFFKILERIWNQRHVKGGGS
jgi:phosphoglycolate phosphatase-like HAD superfamily hydrolase